MWHVAHHGIQNLFYFSKYLSYNAFLCPFIIWGLLLSMLYHYEYKLATFQSGELFVPRWFLQGAFTFKALAPLPNVFIAACFASCRFILVVQVRGKIWNVCYAGQNHFTSWCGALLFLYPFSSHFCIRLPVITWHCNFNFFSFGRHQC